MIGLSALLAIPLHKYALSARCPGRFPLERVHTAEARLAGLGLRTYFGIPSLFLGVLGSNIKLTFYESLVLSLCRDIDVQKIVIFLGLWIPIGRILGFNALE